MRPRRCQFLPVDPYLHVCQVCGHAVRTSSPHPRIVRECAGRPLEPRAAVGPERPARREATAAELDRLWERVAARQSLESGVTLQEAERRLEICQQCPELFASGEGSAAEVKCGPLCQGCADRHSTRLVEAIEGGRECPRGRHGADRLAVVTCYFNPAGYRTRRENFRTFAAAAVSQGAELVVIEAGTPGRWEVDPRPGIRVLRVEWRDALWQKERLLNVAIDRLQPEYGSVAWVDGDIVFDDPEWIRRTRECLGRHRLCQLFGTAQWLSRYGVPEPWYPGGPIARLSVPKAFESTRGHVHFGHGHPGFAWAARRETLLEVGGLYDRHILGSGDTIMVLGWYGWPDHAYLERFTGPFKAAARRWVERTGRIVRGDVGYVKGNIRHLWHGERANRDYDGRILRAAIAEFDPDKHLELDAQGLWAWSASAPEQMKRTTREYFYSRKEDGDDRAAR